MHTLGKTVIPPSETMRGLKNNTTIPGDCKCIEIKLKEIVSTASSAKLGKSEGSTFGAVREFLHFSVFWRKTKPLLRYL